MTSSEATKQIFLSYARADGREHVQRLDRDLRAHQYRVWWDQRDINYYQDFSAEIEIAIRNSAYVVACITPSIEANPDSFVRREIIYAQARKIPIIPLVFPPAIPIILINHLTWLEFGNYQTGLTGLLQRLEAAPQPDPTRPTDDPFHAYLEEMLQAINRQLEARDIERLIKLVASPTPGMVQGKKAAAKPRLYDYHRTQADSSPLKYEDFTQAVQANQGRLLLLGEPGAGKSVTLLAYARQAFTNRLNDPKLPLPFYADLVTWDSATHPPLAIWAGESATDLESTATSLIERGQALLILDGLDELGESRPVDPNKPDGDSYDPRQRLLTALDAVPQTNQVLISCRIKDYNALMGKTGRQLPLNGALTLQPLSDSQLEAYFAENRLPQLWDALQADPALLEVARTPLLLSLFTYAFKEADPALLESFQGKPSGDLHDLIFNTYLEQRWRFEERKANTVMQMGFATYKRLLAKIAYDNVVNEWQTENRLEFRYLVYEIQQPYLREVLDLALLLHSMVKNEDGSYRFIHLKLRDTLAHQQALVHLNKAQGYRYPRSKAAEALGKIGTPRGIPALMEAVHDQDKDVRYSAVQALGEIGDPSAIPTLIEALHDPHTGIKINAEAALIKIGTPSAIPALVEGLHNPNWEIRFLAARALGRIGDPNSATALIELINNTETGLYDRWEDGQIHDTAIEALERIGTPAIPFLIESLHNPNSNTRSIAASILGIIGNPHVVHALIKALQDTEVIPYGGRVCNFAAQALEKIGTAEALAALTAWKQEDFQRKLQP